LSHFQLLAAGLQGCQVQAADDEGGLAHEESETHFDVVLHPAGEQLRVYCRLEEAHEPPPQEPLCQLPQLQEGVVQFCM